MTNKEKKERFAAFHKKILTGTHYLINDYENFALKIENGKKTAKLKRGIEFTPELGSSVLFDTLNEMIEITKEQYDNH